MNKRFAAAFLAATILAACGGGGSSGSTGTTPSTTAPSPSSSQASPSSTAHATLQLVLLTNYTPGSPVTQPSAGSVGTNAVALNYTAVGQTQYVLVFEPGFSGTFAFSVASCTLTPAAVTLSAASASGPQAILAITSASAGTCAVNVTDGTTINTAEIEAVVTTTSGTISVKHRM